MGVVSHRPLDGRRAHEMCLLVKDSMNLTPARAVSACETPLEHRETHHLQLVLPEFLLSCLVQKGKVAHMMHEDVPEDRQVRVDRCDLAEV